ncbi:MAG: 2-oxo acid dehydrogenase subunit E2, partial [Candidatus Eremiobacteraeota bacterium]|nr:2-oxo acid dehydrogenase subunit E2 [Candidatus Eremiobacteraeota bacterium]
MPESDVDATVKVMLPEMGESVTEGSIVEWRKRVGDFVAEGDALVDVTTDKVDVEVPATASGVITQILAGEGDTVSVGAVLAEIDTTKSNGQPKIARVRAEPAATPSPKVPVTPPALGGGLADQPARRMARRLDVDLARVHGSGPNGLILRADVVTQADAARRRVAADGAATALPPVLAGAVLTPLKGPAAALAGYMEQSLTIPTATSFRAVAVDVLDARRKELNGAIRAAGRSEKVSFTHVVAFALVRAARDLPFITFSFRRDEKGAPARLEPGIHLGLAVDSERKDGTRFLVVPVIKDAGALDFAEFRAKYEELVAKARDNKLVADDLQGASFTLTNPGGIGTVASLPRLMAGQGAIIATGAIGYPPGFGNANEQSLQLLGVSKVMQMTSTYDHRVIQGAQSGEYLRHVDELLQGRAGFYEAVFESLGLQAAPVPHITTALPAARAPGAAVAAPPSDEMLRAVAGGMAIVSAYRRFGHLAATLDPLGTQPVGDSSLDPQTYGLTPALMSAIPASVLRVKVPGNTLSDVLPHLRETYSSTIAYEIEHISNAGQRVWLRDYIESGKNKIKFSPERQLGFLTRLTRVEAFDRYVRKTFLGQKTFSGEGLDVMVPMLEEMLDMFADDGIRTAVLGMAHRGRLNVIAHVVNTPYEEAMMEFEAAQYRGELGDDDVM